MILSQNEGVAGCLLRVVFERETDSLICINIFSPHSLVIIYSLIKVYHTVFSNIIYSDGSLTVLVSFEC